MAVKSTFARNAVVVRSVSTADDATSAKIVGGAAFVLTEVDKRADAPSASL
jgi:hypothetical protein